MSLESLLAADAFDLYRPAFGQDASMGVTQTFGSPLYTGVPGRVEDASSSQVERYMQMGMQIDTLIFTQQTDVLTGDLIRTSDNRTLQVQGTTQNRQLGSISTYYEIPCKQFGQGLGQQNASVP